MMVIAAIQVDRCLHPVSSQGFTARFQSIVAADASAATGRMNLASKILLGNASAARLRLVCLPYAGGTAAAYHRWRPVVPQWFELAPVELPGHGTRLSERPRTDLRQLAVELIDELQPSLDGPFAILGHSMGTWFALELTRELRRRGARMPELLVVASGRPPHLKLPHEPLHELPDDELVQSVSDRYDGIPQAVRESPELLQLLLPGLRADLQMLETYEYRDEAPLATAMLVLGGAEDRAVPMADLSEWRRHTTGDFALRLTPGGHFALFQGTKGQPSDGLSIVISRLEDCLSQAK